MTMEFGQVLQSLHAHKRARRPHWAPDTFIYLVPGSKFEVAHACIALRVLVRRLIGMDADVLRQAVLQRKFEALMLCPEIEQFPAGETLQ